MVPGGKDEQIAPSFAIRLVLWIWNGLHRLADKLLPPEIRVVQLVSNMWKSIAIHTAAELQIAEHLTHGSKSVDELAKALPVLFGQAFGFRIESAADVADLV